MLLVLIGKQCCSHHGYVLMLMYWFLPFFTHEIYTIRHELTVTLYPMHMINVHVSLGAYIFYAIRKRENKTKPPPNRRHHREFGTFVAAQPLDMKQLLDLYLHRNMLPLLCAPPIPLCVYKTDKLLVVQYCGLGSNIYIAEKLRFATEFWARVLH